MEKKKKKMDRFDGTDVTSEGIYHTQFGRLCCSICASNSMLENWKAHAKSHDHVLLLEIFKNNFKNHIDHVSCINCKEIVQWQDVKQHAISHKIIPWYEPLDKYRILYKNNAFKFSSNYYCHLCDVIVNGWVAFYHHLEDAIHVQLRDAFVTKIPTQSRRTKYSHWIATGFAPSLGHAIECKMCKICFTNVEATNHAESLAHRQKQSKFIENLMDRCRKSKVSTLESAKSVETIPESPKIVKKDDSKTEKLVPSSRAMICNFFVEPKILETEKPEILQKEPIQGQLASNLSNLNPSNNDFIGTPLDCVIRCDKKLYKTVISKMGKKRQAEMEKQNHDYDWFCQICSTLIPKNVCMYEHLTVKKHIQRKAKYKVDQILHIENDNYYCQSCDCCIKAIDIHRHITSEKHLKDPFATPFCQELQSWPLPAPSCQTTPSWQSATPSWQSTTPSCQSTKPSWQSATPSCQTTPSWQSATPSCQSETESSPKTSVWRVPTPPPLAATPFCQVATPLRKKTTPSCKISSQIRKVAKLPFKTLTSSCNTSTPSYDAATPYCDAATLSCEATTPSCDAMTPSCEATTPSCDETTPSSENASCIFIVKKNAKKLICQVCEDGQYLVSRKNLVAHVTSLKHKISLKRYGCENIVNLDNGDYHCACCDLEIPNLETVHLHVKDKKHTSSLIKKIDETEKRRQILDRTVTAEERRQQNLENLLSDYIGNEITTNSTIFPQFFENLTDNENSKQTDLSTISSSMAADLSAMIKQFNDNRKNQHEKNLQKDRKKIFLTEQLKKIRCPICKDQVDDLTALHSHMAKHFSDDFTCKKNRPIASPDFPAENLTTGVAILNGTEKIESTISQDSGTSSPIDDPSETRSESSIGHEKKSEHSPRKFIMRKIIRHLDFDQDFIYDMSDKLDDIKLGLELCLIVDSASIYCLVCRKTVKNTLQTFHEHLCSLDHCNYHDLMDKDHYNFQDYSQQLSDRDLADQYMEELNDYFVRCFVCDKDVANVDEDIFLHINDKLHFENWEQTRAKAITNYEDVKARIKCDWYSVEKYWCVLCRANMESEVDFVKHLKSANHRRKLRLSENKDKTMIFDFCPPCALLWFGYRCTYSYHSEIPTHKWLIRDGHYELQDLPIFAKTLLTTCEKWIDDTMKFLDDTESIEREKESRLIKDVERFARKKFPRAKAHAFGSRITGLGSEDSDMDILIDCQNMYDGKESSKSKIVFFIEGVHQCLLKDPKVWDVEELLTNCRSPIIRALHRATGLSCDLSFENGLSVENSKLIKTFNRIFPPCRKLILILKHWLKYCDLSGTGRISSYALCWWVIFYFQQEGILPSIANLITMRNKSHIIAGWETGVAHDFSLLTKPKNMTILELLTRFFKFYADYNFRHEVASPFLGESVKKRCFANIWDLPPEMTTYIDYFKNNNKAEPFRIDSPMCIQDPFDLQHNLTKAVSKVYLNRFRTCCAKSLDLLCSNRRTLN